MIVYNGIEYPTRELDMGEPQGVVTVSTLQLQLEMIDGEYEEIRPDAEVIDEQLFWFCNEEEWELSDEKLIIYIKNLL